MYWIKLNLKLYNKFSVLCLKKLIRLFVYQCDIKKEHNHLYNNDICFIYFNQDLAAFVQQQATKLDEQRETFADQLVTVKEQTLIFQHQSVTIEKQSKLIVQLRQENKVWTKYQ